MTAAMFHNFLYSYQHLPEAVSPIAFSVGPFSVQWYPLMYLVGFLVVYLLLRYRIANGEGYSRNKKQETRNKQIQNSKLQILNANTLFDLLIWIFVGLIIGARLGYVLFYNLPYYWQYPLAVISPWDPVTHQYIGIYGMSYHGGLIGVFAAAWFFTRRHKLDFWGLGNFIAPAVPAGYFFGRIGNFMNGELWGRTTTVWWGMYFPGSAGEGQNFAALSLRYPSQFIEAFLEGILLFLILWPLRNKKIVRENALVLYLLGYALARFVSEFFRQPDSQLGFVLGPLTMGQVLSVALAAFAVALCYFQKRKRGV
jgi:phosphatidylglycerol:prolipoprotein diacylglycerol transferase